MSPSVLQLAWLRVSAGWTLDYLAAVKHGKSMKRYRKKELKNGLQKVKKTPKRTIKLLLILHLKPERLPFSNS